MSRKSAVLALAAALAVGGTSIAAAGDDDHDGRAIRLTAKNAGLSIVENGQPGLNRGDRAVVAGDLFQAGQKVGEAALDCVAIRADGTRLQNQCVGSMTLAGGDVDRDEPLERQLAAANSGTAAVVGGTGRYRRAHGEVTMTVTADGLTGDVVIHLR